MKKISLFIIIGFCLLFTGCSKETKEAGNLVSFENVASEKGFNVTNNLMDYQGDTYIVDSKVAMLDDITIEMVIYNNDGNAKKVQDQQIDSFMNLRSNLVTVDKEKGKNFYKFTMISNGYYMINSRIDNTLIFSKTVIDNKDMVDTIFTSLGY